MRITIHIDDDLLAAATELARYEVTTVSAVVSRLLRQELTARGAPEGAPRHAVQGFRPFAAKPGALVTNEILNRLRDEEIG
jgi:Arc/MetJ family transcription regulator